MRKLGAFVVGVSLVLMLVFVGGAPTAAAGTTFFVRNDGADATCNGLTDAAATAAPNCGFKTIQNAVNTALDGDTIIVHGGPYAEQVNITKNLTLTGDSAASTSLAVPASPTANVPSSAGPGLSGYALVGVSNNATLAMSGFTVNGPWSFPSNCGANFFGLFAYGSGTLTLSNSTVSNIKNTDQASAGGCQQGVAIQVGRNVVSEVGHATLTNVTVTGFQKNGITVDAAGSSATISGSHITSAPSSVIATNGIQISRGATASVTGSDISGNECNSAAGCTSDPIPSDPNLSYAAGILLYNPAAGITIQGNTITGNDVGIDHYVPTTDGNTINVAQNTSRKKNVFDRGAATSGPQQNIVAVGTPTQITGNTLTDNRYEGIILEEGTANVAGNSISVTSGHTMNIGVEVPSYNGSAGNSQGTVTNNLITGASVAGIQLQLDPAGTTFIAKISGDSNNISGNTIGVNNTTTTAITLTNNYWGTPNGPKNSANTFNVSAQGNSVTANVAFVPWWSNISGSVGSFTGDSFAPVTTTAPANSQFASIQAAVTAATSGTISTAAGTFTEAVTVGKTVTINGAKHGVDARTSRGAASTETILTGGGFSLNADAIVLNGFTVQNPGATVTGIFLSATHSGYQVLNNIIQNNTIGLYGNSHGTTQTLIKQNLMQHNNEAGSASGNAIYADQGSVNILIDNNTFVDNPQGGAASFVAAAGTPQHDITVSNNNADSDISFINTSAVTVSNNTSTTDGLGSLIIIAGGDSGVTITGNTISGGTGSAVLIGDFYGAGTNQNIDIQHNTFTGNAHDGVEIRAGGITTATVTVHLNTFSSNLRDGVNNATPVAIDATKNWWGTPTGPTNAANVGGTGNIATTNVTFSPWCGDSACTLFYGIATKLVYTTQPVGAAAGTPLATQPVVRAEDASGNLGFNFVGSVALALGANPSNAALDGAATVNATHGVATFSGLSLSKAGNGYTIIASSSGLTATSNPFTVNASNPAPVPGGSRPGPVGAQGGPTPVPIPQGRSGPSPGPPPPPR